MHTLQVEKKPLLSLLCVEILPESKKGSDGQQMTPELLNESFSAKPNRKNREMA